MWSHAHRSIMDCMPYSFLEHTADVRMYVTGRTQEELFCDALLGMIAAARPAPGEAGTTPGGGKPVERTLSVSAPDVTALLIDFLSEALVLMHTEREAYLDAHFLRLDERSLEAELRGYVADSFEEDIKAVTYHEADVKKEKDGTWSTNIVFDI